MLSQAINKFKNDLYDKYGLSEEEVEDCLKRAIEYVFTKKHGAFGFFLDIDFNKLSTRTINVIKRKFINELKIQKTIDEYQHIKHITGTLVGGWISRIGDRFISVSLDSLDDMYMNRLSGRQGIYPLMYQPKPERGRYKQGDYHFFYVVSAETMLTNKNQPKINITLSRTSIKLPALIIQKQLNDEGIIISKKKLCALKDKLVYTVQ